jgi:hypothetical protein
MVERFLIAATLAEIAEEDAVGVPSGGAHERG